MGRDFGTIQGPSNHLAQIYSSLFSPDKEEGFLTILPVFLPQRLVNIIPSERNRNVLASQKLIRQICRHLITEKEQKLARKEADDLDILSVTLESGSFNKGNLIDQLMTFLAAGH